MKLIFYSLLLLLAPACKLEKSQSKLTPFPTPVPDSVALPFLPGIVSTDSLDFNSAFSPDGKSYYFSRSENGKYNIYISRFDGKQWLDPVVASFTEAAYSEADAAFAPDGSLYFMSDRPTHALDTTNDFNIWRIRSVGNDQWTAPENVVAINSDSTEYYVSFAPNGNLYFASNRPGGYGLHDIYVSRWVNGAYTTPENLGPAINGPGVEHDPIVTADEKAIIFTSVGREDSHGKADLYYSIRQSDSLWSSARNMGSLINTPTYEYCPYLTPDESYFFFSSNHNVMWIRASFLPNEIKLSSRDK